MTAIWNGKQDCRTFQVSRKRLVDRSTVDQSLFLANLAYDPMLELSYLHVAKPR